MAPTRTDLTSFCARCSLRFSPAHVCPECGGLTVSLDDTSGRSAALQTMSAALQARRGDDVWVSSLKSWPFAAVGTITAIVVITNFGGQVVLGGTVFMGMVLSLSAGIKGIARRITRHSRADAPRVRLLAGAPEGSALQTTIVGTIRVANPIASPVQGRPVALFRVSGTTDDGSIDDGGGTRFDVETDQGDRIPVSVDSAWVDLVLPRPQLVGANERLGQFLASRFPRVPKAPYWLAEAVLADGDRVELTTAVDPDLTIIRAA